MRHERGMGQRGLPAARREMAERAKKVECRKRHVESENSAQLERVGRGVLAPPASRCAAALSLVARAMKRAFAGEEPQQVNDVSSAVSSASFRLNE